MISYAVVPYRPRLGQLTELTRGITGNLAQQIVGEAEPALREIIRDERNRLAESIIGGIPLAALAAIGYSVTRYVVPDDSRTGKAVGYIASAGSLAAGAWWTISRMTEKVEKPEEAPSGPPPAIVQQAAGAMATEAEPRLRKIIADERTRISEAAQAGIPFAAGSLAVFLSTFLVKPDFLKAVGYSLAAVLLGIGTWITFEKTKS